jgi:hypothetical protein
MGIYSHLSTDELTAKRDRLLAALESRLTGPSSVSSTGRSVGYQHANQAAEIRRELDAINAELSRRGGAPARGPIYLVG